MTTHDSISNLINTITDPFFSLTAEDMGLELAVHEGSGALNLELTAGFPVALLEISYKPLLEKALQAQYPNTLISICLRQAIKAHACQLPGKSLRGVKNTIAVASGKGGVGKSTVTVNLATALASLGAKVGILDADIYGPSIPLMLGQSETVQMRGDSYLPVQAHGVQAMSIGYLTNNASALIWRGPMLAKSLIQMLDITLWEDLDYLFIDLPPGTGDIQLTLVQKIPLTAAIVVTTPQQVATLDAQKALSMFAKTGIDVLGLVENMSTHVCSNCNHEEAIFGEGGADALSEAQHCPVLGRLPLASRIREHCDAGTPTATLNHEKLAIPFIQTALRAAMALAKKP